MEVEIVNATENPERVVCTAARGDYSGLFIGDQNFAELMDCIEQEEVPDEVRDVQLSQYRGLGVVSLERKKWKLISRLMDDAHFGPFEHPHITLTVKGVSRSCMAQLTRHRHTTFDVQSMRYVSFEDKTPQPGEAFVEVPALENPGLTGRHAEFSEPAKEMDDEDVLDERYNEYREAYKQAMKSYRRLLALGVPPEDARMVLPIGTKVNLTFTVNLRTLLHIADMRAAGDAQWEIRELTEKVLEAAKSWAPMTVTYYEQNMKGRKNRIAP